jgi:hypothetical protein
MLNKVIIMCWIHGHENTLMLSLKDEKKLEEKIRKFKAVCPTCKENQFGNQPIFIKEGKTILNDSKVYKCSEGHITTISVFGDGRLHVKYGPNDEDFINLKTKLDDLDHAIQTENINCLHDQCKSKLVAIDNCVLSIPQAAGIKTRVRIGDMWDRHGIEPVRSGVYDDNAPNGYSESRTQAANKARLEKLKQQNRNLPENRHPGKRLDKPTQNQYPRKNKKDLDI